MEKLPSLVHGKPITDQSRQGNVGAKHRLRKSYIHPTILNDWLEGQLNERNWKAAKGKRVRAGFNEEETRLLNWLKKDRS
jgi:DNA topoisomerase IB